MISGLAARLRSALLRRLLGVSAEEIRYTFEDVRAELRATRAELKAEIAELRREMERMARPGDRLDDVSAERTKAS